MFFLKLALILLAILILDAVVAFLLTLSNEGKGKFKINFKNTATFSAIAVGAMTFFILLAHTVY